MKRYDCTKTLDYAHECKRLCRGMRRCEECPIGFDCGASHANEKNITIVQEWSDSHPEAPVTHSDAETEESFAELMNALKTASESRIDHPVHYQGKWECIEEMRLLFGDEQVKAFCRLNAYKYRFRAGRKRGVNEAEDMRKAIWYLDYLEGMEGKR